MLDQFHTSDKFGFIFMPWITDQYTRLRYTKLVNEICTTLKESHYVLNYDNLV